jgi:hypothetical protein
MPGTTRRVVGATRVPRQLRIDTPLDCAIRAAGTLDARWGARLGGLRVRASGDDADGPVTELGGRLLDQAALLGVLVTLYDLGLPLLSVACREARGPPGVDAAPPTGPRRTRSRRGDW